MTEGHEDKTRHILVWDLFTRCFHWGLVCGVTTCFVSGLLGAMTVHEWAGYGVSLLVLARIIRGLTDKGYARFSRFLYGPAATLRYLASLRGGQPLHYLGHNPAGAQMVFALLLLVSGLVLTGMATLATIDFEGPLLFINRWVGDDTAYLLQDIHESAPWLALSLVAMHVMGVIVSSVLHHENLVRSMFTGIKDVPPGITPHDEERTTP
jgi:cytochrome b